MNEPKKKSNCDQINNGDVFVKRSVFVNDAMNNSDEFQLKQEINKSDSMNENPVELSANDIKLQVSLKQIFDEIKVLSDKLREIKDKEVLQDDWVFATSVLDRFFLSALILSITVAFLTIFLAVPETAVLE